MRKLSAILLIGGILLLLNALLTYSWVWVGLNRHSIEGWKLLAVLGIAFILLALVFRRERRGQQRKTYP